MPYADQPRSLTHSAPKRGRGSAAYRVACAEVRERVRLGERCWFWRKRGHEACPGRIDLRLPSNARWAFTAHHKHRLMDGGAALVRSVDMAPAHRACNARDGLIAQNARRQAMARSGVASQSVARQRARAGTGGVAQRVPRVAAPGMGARSSEVRAQHGSQTVTQMGSVRDRQSQAW
jgi:hypothetical protein